MKPWSAGLVSGVAVLVAGAALWRRETPEERRPASRPRTMAVVEPRAPIPGDPISRRALERGTRGVPAARGEEAGGIDLPNGTAGWDMETVRAARREEREARAREALFWDDLGVLMSARASSDPASHREAVMDRTATFLALAPSDRPIFEQTALVAVDEIGRAWQRRDTALLDPGGAEGPAQKRYEETKEEALRRIASSLANTALHDRFKARLEEWIDALR